MMHEFCTEYGILSNKKVIDRGERKINDMLRGAHAFARSTCALYYYCYFSARQNMDSL